jgi:hypothetical protein
MKDILDINIFFLLSFDPLNHNMIKAEKVLLASLEILPENSSKN